MMPPKNKNSHDMEEDQSHVDKFERYGLQPFKKGHLFQYINYLKGM